MSAFFKEHKGNSQTVKMLEISTNKKYYLQQDTNLKQSRLKPNFPDIYYIILDAYCGQKELSGLLGFDNSEFINFLRSKGFWVNEYSYSNYSWTRPSIASVLNMEYLPCDSNCVEKRKYLSSNINYDELISKNNTIALAKSLGYKFFDLSIWEMSDNKNFKSNLNIHGYDFIFILLNRTILGKPIGENYLATKTKRNRIKNQFKQLEEISDTNETKFVYAHFLVPHEPFVFDRDGNEYPFFTKAVQKNLRLLYLNQLQYTNTKIKSVINKIFSKYDSLHLPIIIVQGDHGPRDMLSDDRKNERLRMSILNAYFLPGGATSELYNSITPVNSFRMIFRYYFNMKLLKIEDKSYFQGRDVLNSPLKTMDFNN